MTLLLLLLVSPACSCAPGEVPSGQGGGCVEVSPRPPHLQACQLLLGGSQLSGWRRDAEVWAADQQMEVRVWAAPFQVEITPFPYTIDAPFGWWSPESGLVVCGGKNWDDDQV